MFLIHSLNYFWFTTQSELCVMLLATSGNVCITQNGKRKEVNVLFLGSRPLNDPTRSCSAYFHWCSHYVKLPQEPQHTIPVWFSLDPDPLSLAITCICRSRLVLPGWPERPCTTKTALPEECNLISRLKRGDFILNEMMKKTRLKKLGLIWIFIFLQYE